MGTEPTQTTTAAAAEPAEPIINHEERANAVIAAIDALVASLPFSEKTPLAVVRAHRAVPQQFMKSMIVAVQQDKDVRAVTALDTDGSLDRLRLIDAYGPLRARAVRLVEEMDNLLDTARSKLAYDTLDAYNNVKRMARRPGAKQVSFKLLQKDLARKRRTKDGADPAAPNTAPSPGITPPVQPPQKTEVTTHS